VATTSDVTAAIQHKLNAQVDVIQGSFTLLWLAIISRDLDSIRQARERTVRPTRPAILRDMLVETLGQIGRPVNVVPAEIVGKNIVLQIGVGERRVVVVKNVVTS